MSAVSHTNLPPFSACCLHPSKPEHRWSRLCFAPLRLTTAAAFGSRDCRLRLHYRFLPTPLLRHGVGPLPLRLGQQTLLASPFPLPHRHLRFTSVSMLSNSDAPRNLRLLFRLVNAGLLLSELRSARSPYTRHVPPTHRGTADGISTHGNLSSHVRDATFNALSGKEDYSLRARRHTSSLHCTADNSIAFQSTKPRVARSICRVKERVSRLRRHPFARGRFTGDSTPCHTLPKQVRPTSFLFVDCPSIASPASPIR